jgi:DNA-binding CsgD family transcriptional regulator
MTQAPVLVARDEFLILADRRIADAAAGRGQLLLTAGEAGIGKTRLLGSFAGKAQAAGFTVIRAAAYPGDVQSFAGLLLDLASDLMSAPDPALADVGRRLSDRVRSISAADGDGDAHHRRRLLIQDLVDLIIAAGGTGPALLLLEDLHWADPLSLDVLGHLAGRLGNRPLLVAAAYRSDELDPSLPLGELRTRLISQRLAEEIRLPRLDLAQTASVVSAVLGQPVPERVARAIHQRSDGIPLHIEELIAAIENASLTLQSGAMVRNAAVPDTLGGAVLARARQLSPQARDVASAAAVIGRSFSFDLLAAVSEAGPEVTAAGLRELQRANLVLPGADAVTFDFRHALMRDALYADTDLATRRRLHGLVATTAAADRGYRDAFVSAHFEEAQQPADAFRHAAIAAREAAAVSAHMEALELYRRAVRNLPADLPAAERAALLAGYADEAAATDNNAAAAAAYQTAHALLTGCGDVLGAAALVPRMVAVGHLLGDGLDARLRQLEAAQATVAGLDGADRERARLAAAMAGSLLMGGRMGPAAEHAERALRDAARLGDEETELEAACTLGSARAFGGQLDEGWRLLRKAIERATERGQESAAAHGYRMAGSTAAALAEYDRAERWLTEGIRYADGAGLWNHRCYMEAHLAYVQWATGRWGEATRTAQHALADGRSGITTRITAQYVLGYLAMGRGDSAGATRWLSEALSQAEQMGEVHRLSPPLWGLAEDARCRGDFGAAIELCDRGYAASADAGDAAYLFPFLLTGIRAQLAAGSVDDAEDWADRVSARLEASGIPGVEPASGHGRGLILTARGELAAALGELQVARDGWLNRHRFWEGTWAQLDLAAAASKSRRRGEAARICGEVRADAQAAGAAALAAAAEQLAGSLGRSRPLEPWHPLSAREFEVAKLVAAGLTNRQIAEQLVLAPKTVSAHVEHILNKLGAARRTEIAAWCASVRVPEDGRAPGPAP